MATAACLSAADLLTKLQATSTAFQTTGDCDQALSTLKDLWAAIQASPLERLPSDAKEDDVKEDDAKEDATSHVASLTAALNERPLGLGHMKDQPLAKDERLLAFFHALQTRIDTLSVVSIDDGDDDKALAAAIEEAATTIEEAATTIEGAALAPVDPSIPTPISLKVEVARPTGGWTKGPILVHLLNVTFNPKDFTAVERAVQVDPPAAYPVLRHDTREPYLATDLPGTPVHALYASLWLDIQDGHYLSKGLGTCYASAAGTKPCFRWSPLAGLKKLFGAPSPSTQALEEFLSLLGPWLTKVGDEGGRVWALSSAV